MQPRNDSHLQTVSRPPRRQDAREADFAAYEREGVLWSKMAGTAKTLDQRLLWAEKAQAAFDAATAVRR